MLQVQGTFQKRNRNTYKPDDQGVFYDIVSISNIRSKNHKISPWLSKYEQYKDDILDMLKWKTGLGENTHHQASALH